MKRQKLANLLELVCYCVENRIYILMQHAIDRMLERGIEEFEVEYALLRGVHEKRKDQYQDRYHAWNYAIRGMTEAGKDLRVIVSFDKNNLMIITVVLLGAKYEAKNEN